MNSDLLLIFGTGRPSNGDSLAAEGWSLRVIDGPVDLFVASKQSDGTDVQTVVQWDPPNPAPVEYVAWGVHLFGAPPGVQPWIEVDAATGSNSAISFAPVTAVGDATVFALAVVDRSELATLTDPVGYTNLDGAVFGFGPYGAALIASLDVTAGIETPGDSSTVTGEWTTATILVHWLTSAVLGPVSVHTLAGPMPQVTIPIPGVAPSDPHALPPLPPAPPEPTPVPSPLPPWPDRGPG